MAEHEYTPHTGYVRDFYAKYQANLDMRPSYGDTQYEHAEAEFDRWLSQVTTEARAEGERAAAERIAVEWDRRSDNDGDHTAYKRGILYGLSVAQGIARGEAGSHG